MYYQMKKDLYISCGLYLLPGVYEEMPSRTFCWGSPFPPIKFYACPEEYFGYCYALDGFFFGVMTGNNLKHLALFKNIN